MLNFFIGVAVGFLPMWMIQRSAHKWYMNQITGLSRYVAVVQQELWDSRYERIIGKDHKDTRHTEPH